MVERHTAAQSLVEWKVHGMDEVGDEGILAGTLDVRSR